MLLFVVRCWLFAVGRLLLRVGYVLFVVRRSVVLLCVVMCCVLCVLCNVLFAADRCVLYVALLFCDVCILSRVRCLLFLFKCLVIGVW